MCNIILNMISMAEWISEFGNNLKELADEFMDFAFEADCDCYQIFDKLFYLLAPIIASVILYNYIKYLLIFNAFQYEKSVKKRCGHLKKLSKQLKVLAKHYGSFYFRFMPMNHGKTLPKTYTLFAAIKEVLLNTNRPAARGARMNLLFDLIRGYSHYAPQYLNSLETSFRSTYDDVPEEVDPLSDYNLDIMKCSREMIIQGIKDFEIMSAVFRVLESVMED